MDTQTHFKLRSYAGEQDLQPICDLLNLCESVDQLDEGYVTPDTWRVRLDSPDVDKARDVRLWEDAEGCLVGYATTWVLKIGEGHTEAILTMRIHPDVRDKGLEEKLIEWGSERIGEVARERNQPARLFAGLNYQSPEYAAYGQQVLERNGFKPVRYWFKMARDLSQPIAEPQLPEGYTLRHTEGPAEAAKWVDVFNQSFVDHWNHHDETVESHGHFLENDPNYVKERDLVAIAPDGTWAALCFCWIDPKDNEVKRRMEGWIDILGTRRGFRKMGLGTAMLLAGMNKLKAEGMDTAVLGVDAENPSGALRLYEAVGFQKVSSKTTFSKELDNWN